jgi:hypothetical protein
LGLHRKKGKTLDLISEENIRKNRAKPWISNLQIYVGFGMVLTGGPPSVELGGDCHKIVAPSREP